MNENIEVSVELNADLKTVWEKFTDPKHIVNWYFAADDWHCPSAKNNFTLGSEFDFRLEAKNGVVGFNFQGRYILIENQSKIEYLIIGDDRRVTIDFIEDQGKVKVVEIFQAERINPLDMQQFGWQSILDNFKKYVEQ